MADDIVLSPARRVATIGEVEQPGDYCGPRPDGGLWFLLPVPIDREGVEGPRSMIRITTPPWEFRECEDGSLEVRASIAVKAADGVTNLWHGYLDEGNVWRQLPS